MGYGKGTEGGKEWDRYPPHLRIPPTFQPRGCTYGCAYNAPSMTVDSCRQSTLHPFSAARLLHWPRAAHNSACKASVWSLSVCLSVRNPGLSPRSSSSATYSSDVDQEPVASVRFGFPVRGPTHWFLCRLPASFCHGSIGAITDHAS